MKLIPTSHRGLRSRHDTAVFERHALANGVTVWLQRSPVLLTEEGVLVAYFRNVGNVLDPKGKEGLAHFLEHMPFKGTERYPSTEDIEAAIRNVGGGKNATTSRYWTSYFTAAPASDFPVALDVLSQILTRPLMRAEDLEVERGVIQSERRRKFEHGATLAAHDVDELLFGDHPAFSWGIGSEASIDAITVEDVLAFWDAHYHAGNMHLVVGGTFSEVPDVLARLEEAFGGVPAKPALELQLPAMPVPATLRHRLTNPRYSRDRFFVEWVLSENVPDADRDALGLLTSAFSSGMDSPLAVELRDKRGLVYESGLMGASFVRNIGGMISLELPVTGAQYDEVQPVAMELFRNLPDERLSTTLDRWQLGRLTGFHYPTQLCLRLGGDLVRYGEPRSIHQDQAEADDTDLELVHKWRDYVSRTPPVVVETTSHE